MAFGNVIPIDADVARQLARRRIRFRWLVAGLVTLWLAVLMPTLLLTPLPPIATFVALAVLAVLAEHRFVLFGDETSMSASIIVVVASIFMFADTAPLSGPLLIASIAGLYLPHLRSGAASLSLANVSLLGLAAGIAAGVTNGLLNGGATSTNKALVAAAIASISYWYANSVLTGYASSVRLDETALNSIKAQALSEWPVIVLTIGGGLLVIAAMPSIPLVVLAVAAVVVLFEIYVRRLDRHRDLQAPSAPHLAAVTVAVCAATYPTSALTAGVAVIVSFLAIAGLGSWLDNASNTAGAVFVTFTISSVLLQCGAEIVVRYSLCFVAGLVLLCACVLREGSTRAGARMPRTVALGYCVPSSPEFALLASTAGLLWMASAFGNTCTQVLAAIATMSTCCGTLFKNRMQQSWAVSWRRSSVRASR